MNKQKILLLGGSAQQVIAIKKAKELGLYTILCDYLPDNPGQYEADKFYQVSTTDVEAIYDIAKRECINSILAYASDPAALPAAIVAERLGLNTNPSKAVEILGLKNHWRTFLSENKFACPKHFSFNPQISLEELKANISTFSFPIIVKPTDSSGSKGVSKLENLDELENAIAWADSYSRNKILLVEEFITRGFPYVIGGDIFVWNGKIVLYGVMSCLRDIEQSPLIPIGKKLPSGLNEKQTEQLHKELQKIVTALGVKFGELNIEILLDKEDNVHFLELGPRAGGNMIPIQLSDAFDIDLITANIQAAMGIEPDIVKSPIVKKDGCFMHYVLHSYKEGLFKGIEIDKSIEHFVYRQVIYKQAGDTVEYFDGAGKALGIIFLHFDTIEQMEHFCNNHNNLIKVIL